MWGPTNNVGRIGSAVSTFIGYTQTKNAQTDKQSIHIDCLVNNTFLQWSDRELRTQNKT